MSAADSNAPATILAGPPTSIDGFVRFFNDTKATIEVTHVTVRDSDGDEAMIELDPVTVAPGRTARLAVRFGLNPQTEPGAYPLEIDVADTTIPVTAQISAAPEVGISPQVLVVDNVPDSSFTQTVVVANNGNVPVFVADFGAVSVYREDQSLTTLLGISTRTAAAPIPSVEALPEPSGTLTVSTGSGRVEIGPGDIVAVQLDIDVPAGLDQTMRHLTLLPISVRTLLVTLVPAGPDPAPV